MGADAGQRFSRRQFLTYQAIMGSEAGVLMSFAVAAEAVSSTAIEHPEWDMDEQLTWAEWLAQGDGAE